MLGTTLASRAGLLALVRPTGRAFPSRRTVASERRSSRLQSRGGGRFSLPSLGPVASPDVGLRGLFSGIPPSFSPFALEECRRRNLRSPEARRIRREQGPDGSGVGDEGERLTLMATGQRVDVSPDPLPELPEAFSPRSPDRPRIFQPSIKSAGIAPTARAGGPAVPVSEVELPQPRARKDVHPWGQNLGGLQAAVEVARNHEVGPELLETPPKAANLSQTPRGERRVQVTRVALRPSQHGFAVTDQDEAGRERPGRSRHTRMRM